jgi:transposase InsO family protein
VREILILAIHLLVTLAKLLRPGGVRAVAGRPSPKHVSTDHDPLCRFHRWRANLRVLEIEEVESVPYAPVSHPFVERLIGTIRREYLDRVFFWNAVDLARKLEAFRDYHNGHRVHRALAGLTPAQFAGALSPAPAALDHCGLPQNFCSSNAVNLSVPAK